MSVLWGCREKLAWNDCRVAEMLRSSGHIPFRHVFVPKSLCCGIRSQDVIEENTAM